jgi:DNA-binding PadR family transcriptional regulator
MSEEASAMLGLFFRRAHRHRPGGWGRGRGFGGFPFEGFGAGWAEGLGPFGGRGGPGPRVERGDVKLLVLSVLRDGPKHGYEVMRAIEQRTGSAYTPSPGVIYPTLQLLEDLGHVRSREGGDRKVYELTDAGRAHLDEQGAAEQGAWAQFERHGWQGGLPTFGTDEQRQVRDEMIELGRALFAGGRIFRADPARLARVRDALRTARQQIDAAFTEYV